MAKLDLMKEIGVAGAPEFSGRFTERYSSRLQGAEGVMLMAEVLRREPAAYSLHNAVLLTAKRSTWKGIPASDAPADLEAAEFLESCLHDMSTTWWRVVQFALSSGPFGFADVNTVFKRRLGRVPGGKVPASRYEDGLIGLRKMAPRRQETIDHWVFDENGGPIAMVQKNPNSGIDIEIPIENIIHFISGDDRGGWEGLGWLEPGYNIAHMIWNLEVFAGIGWQRALVGVPSFTYLEIPDEQTRTELENMMKGLIVNKKQYVTVPGFLGEFKLLTVENTNADSLLSHISQLRWEMLMLALGTYLRLGSTVSGSRALSFPLIEMFRIGVNGNLDMVRDTLNKHLVPRLFAANADSFGSITDYPQLEHSTVLDLPEEVLSNLIPIQNFLLTSDFEDQRWLRDLLSMPVYEVNTQEEREKKNQGTESQSTDEAQSTDSKAKTATENTQESVDNLSDMIKQRVMLSHA